MNALISLITRSMSLDVKLSLAMLFASSQPPYFDLNRRPRALMPLRR